jgi:hypothetical protein
MFKFLCGNYLLKKILLVLVVIMCSLKGKRFEFITLIKRKNYKKKD